MIQIKSEGDFEDGISEGFFTLPFSIYRKAKAINRGMLVTVMSHSPQATRRPPKKETNEMSLGKLSHALLLEPSTFGEGKSHLVQPKTYINEKDVEKKWNSNANVCKAWKETAEERGLPIVSAADLERIHGAVDAFKTDPLGEQMLANGWTEVSVFARDPETGEMLKVRLDLLSLSGGKPLIADAKFGEGCDEHVFAGNAARFHYPTQNGFYAHVVGLACGCDPSEVPFYYASIDIDEPHIVDWCKVDDLDVWNANIKWRTALNEYIKARETNQWIRVSTIRLPKWAKD